MKNKTRNLTGTIHPINNLHANITSEFDRARWNKQEVSNNSVARVYSVYYEEYGRDNRGHLMHFKASGPYTRFTKEYRNKFRPVITNEVSGNFHEYEEYGYKTDNGQPQRRWSIAESITILKYSDYTLVLGPWHDGVHLIDIDVRNRGNGIGTKVMNDLCDISDELSIPIYLTPYPGDNFTYSDKEEERLIKRLEKWYRKFGFNVSTESTKDIWSPNWWSNME